MTESVSIQIPDRITKSNISHLTGDILSKALNGEERPVTVMLRLKMAHEVIGSAIKSTELHRAVRDEIEQYDKSERVFFGAKVDTRGTAPKWDYSANPKWNEIKEHLDSIAAQLKAHEALLRAEYEANRRSMTVDGEYVENPTGAKCISPGGETIAISFPKE